MHDDQLSLRQRLRRLAPCVFLALVLWNLPIPDGLNPVGWQVFSIFIAVIASFIIRPFPVGAMVIFGLVVLMVTKTLTPVEALAGYADTTVWLVVSAFLIAGVVIHTGFGRRIALLLVSRLGKSTIGLGYSLCGAELILGPFVPSNTARGGGIVAPITDSLARALDSTPENHPERAGQYLTLVGAHANLIAAAMFLTGMAANPLVSRAAMDVFNIEFGWGTWALGALVPGLVGFSLLPLFIFYLAKPTLLQTKAAQVEARKELGEMGAWSTGEKVMAAVFILLLGLWTTKPLHGMSTTLTAWIGISILLITQTTNWDRTIKNDKAWDTLIWLGGLLTMANSLKTHGFIDWFALAMQGWVANIDGLTVTIVLALIYFYSMYAFSMLTAHIAALIAAFFAVALAAGAPALLTIAILAYFSNLCGALTNYSTGPIIVYFGLGYVEPQKWFSTGFLVGLYHLVIWLTVGLGWWKVLGWW
ncbi:DASS family sodium-coupled anion symporter [candidate division KSB1 bacterium]|nr:DASS family sodium-coupled anion symporter [candidate division KSB1 bacterium]